MAIVFSCERFSQYLAGREKIAVETDHKPLQSIFQKFIILSAPCLLQHMLLRLQHFNLDVNYKPGTQMFTADLLLSRASLKATDNTQDNFQVFTIELETLNPFDSIKVTPERFTQLQEATAQDLALETLKTTVVTGWSERKEQVSIQVRDFWITEKRFHSTMGFCSRPKE